MKNKNGFTLMELLVALFLSSMVTVALISIWRGASIQTSQGQRQAIIRNNMSIFLRSLYKDLTEADVILYPTSTGSATNGLLLMSGYNMRRIDDANVAIGRIAEGSFQNSFIRSYYFDETNHRICLNENRTIFGENFIVSASDGSSAINMPDPAIMGISNIISDSSNTCEKVVMDNVNDASISLLNNNNSSCSSGETCRYRVAINIFRDFGGNSVPVSINFERIFVAAGGA
ncbi:MAG: prepilin-type N-terminal cleavage/methylation domain-containing protein [Elusimicrobiota bacterium]|jgi:prepilin-type N-terminal cleavage/methylation domain-containing protein|nr:prepilin-type N-terminal cleavage/methylation domain-containing protein [Elusimicrobiota bacterium]